MEMFVASMIWEKSAERVEPHEFLCRGCPHCRLMFFLGTSNVKANPLFEYFHVNYP